MAGPIFCARPKHTEGSHRRSLCTQRQTCCVWTIDLLLKFPLMVDDVRSAYRWLLKSYAPSDIVFAGDSAGGHLVLASLLSFQKDGLPTPRAAVLLSPWLDFTGSGESMITHKNLDLILPAEEVDKIIRRFIIHPDTTPEMLKSSLFSPVLATNEEINKLPDLLIHVGTTEILYSDSFRLAERVKQVRGEGKAKLVVWDGMSHVHQLWFLFGMPEAKLSLLQIGYFIQEKLHRQQ